MVKGLVIRDALRGVDGRISQFLVCGGMIGHCLASTIKGMQCSNGSAKLGGLMETCWGKKINPSVLGMHRAWAKCFLGGPAFPYSLFSYRQVYEWVLLCYV